VSSLGRSAAVAIFITSYPARRRPSLSIAHDRLDFCILGFSDSVYLIKAYRPGALDYRYTQPQ